MFVAPSGKTNNTVRRPGLHSGFIHDFSSSEAVSTRLVHSVPTIGAHTATASRGRHGRASAPNPSRGLIPAPPIAGPQLVGSVPGLRPGPERSLPAPRVESGHGAVEPSLDRCPTRAAGNRASRRDRVGRRAMQARLRRRGRPSYPSGESAILQDSSVTSQVVGTCAGRVARAIGARRRSPGTKKRPKEPPNP